MSLTQAIKDEARRLGFQLVGVTTPDPPPHLSVYTDWLKAGRHGQMGYLASERSRQRRADPRQILPDCRSILVLGMPYYRPGDKGNRRGENKTIDGLHMGRVSSYAWGDDYHDALPERMQNLVRYIEGLVGHPISNRTYTDTGPILERDLAQRAGLGWIGKNTCLINPGAGSYFFLAEILLGIELEPDPPFTPDHCGSCTRCIDTCPTGCILPDRTLDARRCISYLTIEQKGIIPVDLRPLISDWVFGCDVCQQVCPWNQRFATPQGDLAFAPRPGVPRPNLVQELSLTPQGFSLKFSNSPVKRARRRGYLRNVTVALGNSRDPSAIPALAHSLLNDPEPLVRAHAAWALGKIRGENAKQALDQAIRCENNKSVLAEIRSALSELA